MWYSLVGLKNVMTANGVFCSGWARRAATIATQLEDVAVESDQFTVEMVERTEAKIAVFEQVGHRGVALVHAAQQGAHQSMTDKYAVRMFVA